MVQSLFYAARRGCAGIGGQGLGCLFDDVVNRDEPSSGCTDGLGMHPSHAPCAQQSYSDHDLPPFKMSTFTSGGTLIGKGEYGETTRKGKIKYVWASTRVIRPKKRSRIRLQLVFDGDPGTQTRRHQRLLLSRCGYGFLLSLDAAGSLAAFASCSNDSNRNRSRTTPSSSGLTPFAV